LPPALCTIPTFAETAEFLITKNTFASPDIAARDLRFASFEATPRNYARALKDENSDWECGANSGICRCPSQHHYIAEPKKNTNVFLRWYG
jgi:hypothetical protein